jgi:hypothetical protein
MRREAPIEGEPPWLHVCNGCSSYPPPPPGDNPSLTATLDAANHVIICNIPGHRKQGMHTTFAVS